MLCSSSGVILLLSSVYLIEKKSDEVVMLHLHLSLQADQLTEEQIAGNYMFLANQ